MGFELIPLVLAAAAAAAGDPIVLDAQKQLFLDDYLVESAENIARTIHSARKSPANPLLWPAEPWEGTMAIVYGSILRDGELYRMWYHGSHGVSYAESPDGLAWSKPALGLFEVDGSPTNIVIHREAEEGQPNYMPFFYEVFGVHKDPDAADPNRRYVLGYLSIQRDYDGPRRDPFHGGQRRGLGVAYSPDGIHWTSGEPWATEAICDGATHWMRDPASGHYVLYGRTKFAAPDVKAACAGDPWLERYFWGRAVARVESPDFLDWDYKDPATAPVVMASDTKDTPGDEIYSMLVFPYEGVYIGLVQMFHNQEDTCHLDIQLAVSRDGVAFARVGDRTPFIPCGGVGEWDRFNNSLANNPPLRVDDELRFYYGGRTYRHSPYEGPDAGESGGGIGLATIALDRFVSLDASFDGGTLLTKPLVLGGDTLHLNATCDFGAIGIEVLGADGAVAARAKPVRSDGLDIPVEWEEGGLANATGPVQLRFTLSNARLFAVWCE
ncbi:MAG: hypothetical protein JXR94_14670 [Candidatus Hydrogenedentes bacterium]|nr:hypothetical protein [Candidatus Hydrogenedentota bacterium]